MGVYIFDFRLKIFGLRHKWANVPFILDHTLPCCWHLLSRTPMYQTMVRH